MYPYVLKLTFGSIQAINDASNTQPQRQPYQSSMNNIDLLQGFVRPSLAEFFGSLLFVLLSALLAFSTVNSQLSTSVYEGAIVFLLMCMFARISGGHFNPAITISVLLCGQCRITLGICIIFMQLFGSFIGATLTRSLILEAAYIDIFRGSVLDESNAKLVNRIQAFLLEMLLSFLISSTYLFTSIDTKGNNGIFCSAAVSIARSLVSFIGYRPLGQCANIARSIATSAAASIFFFDVESWRVLYVYFFGNIAGAVLASVAYWISRPQPLECIITDECKDGTRGSRED